jgi:peptide/nickel transport system substrate-binding protein
VTRHLAVQAGLALLGIALVFVILYQLATSRELPTITAELPEVGGSYVEGVIGYAETIDPVLAPLMSEANPVDQDLSILVFDGLTMLDITGHISPALALEWDVSEDGLVYEFRLRQGVTWHDGAPFTAADVVFTVQAMQDPDFQGDPALQELWKGVTVTQVNDYTVRFELREPFPSFMYYTAIGILPVHLLGDVPAAQLPAHPFSTESPVGTGMFRVESIQPDRIDLVAYPGFWGRTPYLERLEFRFFGDWEGLLAAYERDEILGFRVQAPRVLSSLATMPELQLYSAQSATYGLIYLNLRLDEAPYFQDREVRQALLYALDRQALIDQVLEGQGLIADSPIPPASWAFDPSVPRYRYDPERAIGLLDASGWVDTNADRIRDNNESVMSFDLITSDVPVMTSMAEEIAAQWRLIGVDVTVRPLPGESVTDMVRQRSFAAALIEISPFADPDPYPLWHSTQAEGMGQNFSGFADEDADRLMEQARAAVDSERRIALYHEFQRIFAEEVPALLLYYPVTIYAVDAQVRGVQLTPLLHPSDRFRNLPDWFVETRQIPISEPETLDKSNDSW